MRRVRGGHGSRLSVGRGVGVVSGRLMLFRHDTIDRHNGPMSRGDNSIRSAGPYYSGRLGYEGIKAGRELNKILGGPPTVFLTTPCLPPMRAIWMTALVFRAIEDLQRPFGILSIPQRGILLRVATEAAPGECAAPPLRHVRCGIDQVFEMLGVKHNTMQRHILTVIVCVRDATLGRVFPYNCGASRGAYRHASYLGRAGQELGNVHELLVMLYWDLIQGQPIREVRVMNYRGTGVFSGYLEET